MKKKVASLATVAILSSSISTSAFASNYTVQMGDNLSNIAKKNNMSISEIKSINNLKSDALFINQQLKLSAPNTAQTNVPAPSAKQNEGTYTIAKGDNLTKIANKHGITLAELKLWNNLTKDTIYAEQTLIVKNGTTPKPPTPGDNGTATKPGQKAPDPKEYVIKSGDSLSKIAVQFNLTVEQLKSMNGLKSDLIFPGQKLIISGEAEQVTPDGGEQQQPTPELPPTTDNVVINEAMKLIGTPYQFGGSTIEAFDCSGFIYYAFNKAGKTVNRLSAEGYYNRAYYVDSPQPGDLVFFENTYKPGISHMGIYIGDNKFIHASTTNGVEIMDLSNSYYQKHFDGFKRFY